MPVHSLEDTKLETPKQIRKSAQHVSKTEDQHISDIFLIWKNDCNSLERFIMELNNLYLTIMFDGRQSQKIVNYHLDVKV
ncbi:unnamed protein product, partial [Bubo scandiacus]